MIETTESVSTALKLDASNYKAGVTEVNRQIRVLESGFRASISSMDDWSNSASGLEERNRTLAQQIDLQRQKVESLTKVYKEMAADEKTSAKEKDEMTIRINREKESLGKLESELQQNTDALGKLGQKEQETGRDTETFKQKMDTLASGLKATVTAIAAVATAVAGVGLAVGKMVLDTAKASDELSELSTKTGISTTRLQELSYIGQQVGTEGDTITRSLSRLISNMRTASEGTGETAEAFRKLGVPLRDADGQLRDSRAVWGETIDALGKVANETNREFLANTLFGKSFLELNPLIKAGSGELTRLAEEAHSVGAVMKEEDVSAMGNLNDKLDSLKAGLKGTVGTMAVAFLPAFQGLTDMAGGYLKQFSDVVRNSNGDLGQMAAGIGQLVGRIASDVATQGPKMMQAGLSILQGIVTAIVANLPTMLPAVISMITSLVNFIVQNLPMIIEAGLQIIIALVNGLTQALPTLIPAVVAIIPQIVTTLLQNLPLLILAAVQLILALAQGLIAALPVLIPEIPKIVQAIFDALIVALPLIGIASLQLIITLADGIISNLPMVAEQGLKTVETFKEGIWGILSSLNDVGRSIVGGVWSGIQSKYNEFRSQVQGFFKGIVDSVKGALGIHSPSTVFAGIGENMAAGLGIGFMDQFDQIRRSMDRAVSGMSFAGATAGSGFGNGGGNSTSIRNNNLTMGGIHIAVQGGGDANQIGSASEMGVRKALRAAGLA